MVMNSRNNLVNPNLLRLAAQHGVRGTDLPMGYDKQNYIAEELVRDLGKRVEQQLGIMQQQDTQAATLDILAKNIEKSVMHNTDKSIDSASLAAASVIMPRLAKKPQFINPALRDWSDFSDNPPPLADSLAKSGGISAINPNILSGLSEGGGEDIMSDNQGAQNYRGGGGTFAPEGSTLPQPSDFSALEPGRENLPAFDMTPKQKAAYAQQLLEQQLAQAPAKKAGGAIGPGQGTPADATTPGRSRGEAPGRGRAQAPTQPTNSMDELLQLQQNIADEGEDFSVGGKQSLEDRMHHMSTTQAKHKYHRYKKLLAKDQKYLQAQQQADGQIKQGLMRKALYAAGLSALDKQSTKVGKKIQSNIEHGKFTGFIFALAIALIVDAISIGVLFVDGDTLTSLLVDILNIALIICLGVIILGHGHYFMRWVIKRLFGKQILRAMVTFFSMFVEFVPIGSAIPMWTIQILWLKYDVNKAIKEHKKDLKELNEAVKKEILKAKRGQVNERKIAQLKKRLGKLQKKAYA